MMKRKRLNQLTAAVCAVSLSLLAPVLAFAETQTEATVEGALAAEVSVEASDVQILDDSEVKSVVVVAGAENVLAANSTVQKTTFSVDFVEAKTAGQATPAKDTEQTEYIEQTECAEQENLESNVPREVYLDIPQVYALDSRWSSIRFDPNAKDTIGKAGCTICCLTAIMSYIDGTLYRPDELCKRMSFSNGAMAWYGEIDGKFKTNQNYSLSTIKEKLLNREPVIVKSYQRAKNEKGQWYNKAHFVVVTGFKNNGESEADYMIMDPGRQDTSGRTLKSLFSTHPNNKALYYLKK